MRGFALVLALVLCADAARADDWNWSGLYFGAQFAAGRGTATTDTSFNYHSEDVRTGPNYTQRYIYDDVGTGSGSGEATGSMTELLAGYNARFASFLMLGVQLEGTVFSNVEFTTRGNSVSTSTRTEIFTNNGTTTTTVETYTDTSAGRILDVQQLSSVASANLRLGFLATPSTLLYAIGGVSYGNFDLKSGSVPGSLTQWELGYNVGGGLEQKLTRNWSIRGEYRYMSFDIARNTTTSSTYTQQDYIGTSTNETTTDSQLDMHMGKVGVVYTFD